MILFIVVISVLVVLLGVRGIGEIVEKRKTKKLSYWFGDTWNKYD